MKIKYYDVNETIVTNYVRFECRLSRELLEFFANDDRPIMTIEFDMDDNLNSRRMGVIQRMRRLGIVNCRTLMVQNKIYIIKT